MSAASRQGADDPPGAPHMGEPIRMLSSDYESANAHLAAPTEAVLRSIGREPALHARFLNTLSMLEHMGSHKIMVTQSGPTIDQPTLKHLAEEARHAFFFKRLAEREAGGAGIAGLLAPAAARGYFGRLEAEVMARLPGEKDLRAPYLIMSLIVEFRAVWAYRIYQDVLTGSGHVFSLNSLLAEEAGHLEDMAERLEHIGQFDLARIRDLCRIETGLYQKFLAALSATVSPVAA